MINFVFLIVRCTCWFIVLKNIRLQIVFITLKIYRNFDDFLVTLEAQGEKFEGLKRLTLLERAYSMQRKTESERYAASGHEIQINF